MKSKSFQRKILKYTCVKISVIPFQILTWVSKSLYMENASIPQNGFGPNFLLQTLFFFCIHFPVQARKIKCSHLCTDNYSIHITFRNLYYYFLLLQSFCIHRILYQPKNREFFQLSLKLILRENNIIYTSHCIVFLKWLLLNLCRQMHLGLVGIFSWFGLIIKCRFMAVFPVHISGCFSTSNKENL